MFRKSFLILLILILVPWISDSGKSNVTYAGDAAQPDSGIPRIKDMAISCNGKYMSIIEETFDSRVGSRRIIKYFDLNKGLLLWQTDGENLNLKGIFRKCILSAKGNLLSTNTWFGDDLELIVWKVPDGNVIFKSSGYAPLESLHAFSFDGRFLASSIDCMKWDDNLDKVVGEDKCVKIFDVQKGELFERLDIYREYFDVSARDLAFSPDSIYIAIAGTNYYDVNLAREVDAQIDLNYRTCVLIWNIFRNKKVSIIRGSTESIYPIGFNEKADYILVGHKIYRVSDGKLAASLDKFERLPKMGFGNFWISSNYMTSNIKSPNLLVADEENKGIKIIDSNTGNLKVTLYSIPKGSVFLTPEGYFTGSGDFKQYVGSFRRTTEPNFNQFYNIFYRPDFVQKKLLGEDISKYTK